MKFLKFLLILLTAGAASAQTENAGIGTLTPDPSARLEVASDNQGFLLPRVTTAQRLAIVSPALSLLVFDSDTGSFWFFNGTTWIEIDATTAQSSSLIFSFLDQSSLNGTAESAIGSYVFPANTLTTDGEGLEINAFGEINTDSSVIRFKVGPNALVFPANTTGSWNAVIRIYRKSATEFKMTGTLSTGGNAVADFVAGLQNFSVAAPFQITGQQETAVPNGITMEGFVISRVR